LGISNAFSIDVWYHALQFGSSYLFKKETHKYFMASFFLTKNEIKCFLLKRTVDGIAYW
jgi:hypothetical protein